MYYSITCSEELICLWTCIFLPIQYYEGLNFTEDHSTVHSAHKHLMDLHVIEFMIKIVSIAQPGTCIWRLFL